MKEYPDDFRFQENPAGTEYELRIEGRLVQPTLAWFEDMQVTIDESTVPPQTVISGPVRDQAALYGYVNRIRDLGLVLLSVKRVQSEED